MRFTIWSTVWRKLRGRAALQGTLSSNEAKVSLALFEALEHAQTMSKPNHPNPDIELYIPVQRVN